MIRESNHLIIAFYETDFVKDIINGNEEEESWKNGRSETRVSSYQKLD